MFQCVLDPPLFCSASICSRFRFFSVFCFIVLDSAFSSCYISMCPGSCLFYSICSCFCVFWILPVLCSASICSRFSFLSVFCFSVFWILPLCVLFQYILDSISSLCSVSLCSRFCLLCVLFQCVLDSPSSLCIVSVCSRFSLFSVF